MPRPLSPIERMIDQACGVGEDHVPGAANMMVLRCGQCRRLQDVAREVWDPPTADVVEADCPRCATENPTRCVTYYDADGAIIPVDLAELGRCIMIARADAD